MSSFKPIDEAARDFPADLAGLRDDIAKLTASVSELLRAQASTATDSVLDAADSAGRKMSDAAAGVKEKVSGASADLEAAVERNPLTAVLLAMLAGMLIGMFSRARK